MSETNIWDIQALPQEKDRLPRGEYLIPCLLADTDTSVHIKAVILDLSGSGCRVFTNDKRVRVMETGRLLGETFRIDFDFYDVDTGEIQATVRNVRPGKNPLYERQLGLEFTDISPEARRDINRHVQGDISAHKA